MPFVQAAGRRLEYERAGPKPDDAPTDDAPTLVFPRQGLGSLSMWRDFPAAPAGATGCGMPGYGRWGHGKSEPLTRGNGVRFMHDQTLLSLPDILTELAIRELAIREPILAGQSAGGSSAPIHAGSGGGPAPKGLIVEAAHVFADKITEREAGAA